MGKTMLVNIVPGEERRIAVLDDGNLDNLFIERVGQTHIVGNIYKAKVVAVEQSLQSAFVEFGGERQGFLHISDVAPSYYQDKRAARRKNKSRASVSAALKRGQEVLVQVTKEGIGKKAPAVTTFISLPGRYLVLMPQIKRRGVSRKIGSDEERDELRKVLDNINPPEDMGIIVRTAAAGRGKREVHRDMNYLLRLWMDIRKKAKSTPAPALLYEESDMVIRIVRDVFSPKIDKMVIDDKKAYDRVLEFMKTTMPNSKKRSVQLYREKRPLFARHNVEQQIEKIHNNRVALPGGGSIVIDPTEALVAIDVNSGKFRKESNAEETAFRINLQAADEIGRQLRLRDLGGLIICDFIDMRSESHKREVERALWNQLKDDRARTKMLRMSRFGIVEMTRQRQRRSLEHAEYAECPMCKGRGQIRKSESIMMDLIRRIRMSAHSNKGKQRMVVQIHPDVLVEFQNQMRTELAEVEDDWGGRIVLEPSDGAVDSVDIKCYKA
jgi:ribonuclease E